MEQNQNTPQSKEGHRYLQDPYHELQQQHQIRATNVRSSPEQSMVIKNCISAQVNQNDGIFPQADPASTPQCDTSVQQCALLDATRKAHGIVAAPEKKSNLLTPQQNDPKFQENVERGSLDHVMTSGATVNLAPTLNDVSKVAVGREQQQPHLRQPVGDFHTAQNLLTPEKSHEANLQRLGQQHVNQENRFTSSAFGKNDAQGNIIRMPNTAAEVRGPVNAPPVQGIITPTVHSSRTGVNFQNKQSKTDSGAFQRVRGAQQDSGLGSRFSTRANPVLLSHRETANAQSVIRQSGDDNSGAAHHRDSASAQQRHISPNNNANYPNVHQLIQGQQQSNPLNYARYPDQQTQQQQQQSLLQQQQQIMRQRQQQLVLQQQQQHLQQQNQRFQLRQQELQAQERYNQMLLQQLSRNGYQPRDARDQRAAAQIRANNQMGQTVANNHRAHVGRPHQRQNVALPTEVNSPTRAIQQQPVNNGPNLRLNRFRNDQIGYSDIEDDLLPVDTSNIIEECFHPRGYLNDYMIGELIGKGTFGKVRKAKHIESGELVAIKFISKDAIRSRRQKISCTREIRLLSLLRNKYIIKVYELIETPRFIAIVMEYAAGGELFQYIINRNKLEEAQARFFFIQIVEAMYYCHQHSVVHRDLKPENMLLDADNNIKIIDFGFGTTYDGFQLLDTYCGSPFYASPEMVKGIKYSGPEVDVWSMGIILFAMLNGKLPFDGSDMNKLYASITVGVYKIPSDVSPEAAHLIRCMLNMEAKQRPSVEQIMQHSWIRQDIMRDLGMPLGGHQLAQTCTMTYAGTLDWLMPLTPDESDVFKIIASFGFPYKDVESHIYNARRNFYANSIVLRHPILSYYKLLRQIKSEGHLGNYYAGGGPNVVCSWRFALRPILSMEMPEVPNDGDSTPSITSESSESPPNYQLASLSVSHSMRATLDSLATGQHNAARNEHTRINHSGEDKVAVTTSPREITTQHQQRQVHSVAQNENELYLSPTSGAAEAIFNRKRQEGAGELNNAGTSRNRFVEPSCECPVTQIRSEQTPSQQSEGAGGASVVQLLTDTWGLSTTLPFSMVHNVYESLMKGSATKWTSARLEGGEGYGYCCDRSEISWHAVWSEATKTLQLSNMTGSGCAAYCTEMLLELQRRLNAVVERQFANTAGALVAKSAAQSVSRQRSRESRQYLSNSPDHHLRARIRTRSDSQPRAQLQTRTQPRVLSPRYLATANPGAAQSDTDSSHASANSRSPRAQ